MPCILERDDGREMGGKAKARRAEGGKAGRHGRLAPTLSVLNPSPLSLMLKS